MTFALFAAWLKASFGLLIFLACVFVFSAVALGSRKDTPPADSTDSYDGRDE